MSKFLPKAMEDRAAIGNLRSVHSPFLAGEWQGSNVVRPRRSSSTPSFGRARQLHLRAAPGSHEQERERVRSIADAGCAAIGDAVSAMQRGATPSIPDLVDVVDAVTASLLRDAMAFRSVMRLRQQNAHTYMHAVSVCQLMIALATEMRLEPALVRDIGLSGLLHDIGECDLPPDHFGDAAWLDPSGLARVRSHTKRGESMLRDAPLLPTLVLEVCRSHHERPDGSGYPDGLAGPAISIYARMCSICDFYDTVTSPSPGIARWSPGQAIEHLRSESGAFDSPLVTTFVRTIGTFLPGVLVRLRSDRIGVILDGSTDTMMHPDVVVFKNTDDRDLAWQCVPTKTDPILSIERPENWKLGDWPALRDQLLAFSW